MKSKKHLLVALIVAVLAAIVIFPMLPLEYREAITSSSRTRCTTWAWVTGEARPQHPDIAYKQGGVPTGNPTPHQND